MPSNTQRKIPVGYQLFDATVTVSNERNLKVINKSRHMRKVIAAINMTLDGYCDHTAIIPDEKMHEHYSELLRNSGGILYGRITYGLMEYWRAFVEHPSGDKAEDEFAVVMDQTPKIVFSTKLKSTDWNSARIATKGLKEEVEELKIREGKDILVGSPSLIVQLTKLSLIDEYQLCVHPVIAGSGLPLFRNINQKHLLKLVKTKNFEFGGIVLYYEPAKG